jgi:hypothetical protein
MDGALAKLSQTEEHESRLHCKEQRHRATSLSSICGPHTSEGNRKMIVNELVHVDSKLFVEKF